MIHLNEIARKRKKVRYLEKKLEKLRQVKWNLGSIQLEKPIKNGWIKHLVLRSDIARRKDAPVFQEIINQCGIEIWGSSKEHANKEWEKYHQSGDKFSFRGMGYLQGEKRKEISSMGRMWFDGYDWEWIPCSGYIKRYFCKVPRHFFKTSYSKSYITHMQVVDPELDHAIADVNSQLLSKELYKLTTNYKWADEYYHKRKRRKVKVAIQNYDEYTFDQLIYRDFNR